MGFTRTKAYLSDLLATLNSRSSTFENSGSVDEDVKHPALNSYRSSLTSTRKLWHSFAIHEQWVEYVTSATRKFVKTGGCHNAEVHLLLAKPRCLVSVGTLIPRSNYRGKSALHHLSKFQGRRAGVMGLRAACLDTKSCCTGHMHVDERGSHSGCLAVFNTNIQVGV